MIPLWKSPIKLPVELPVEPPVEPPLADSCIAGLASNPNKRYPLSFFMFVSFL